MVHCGQSGAAATCNRAAFGRRAVVFWALVVAGVGGSRAAADVRLPAVIADNMVLQREATVPLWGWAEPGEQVTVRADWRSRPWSAPADGQGRWRIEITTPPAGGPHRLEIAGKDSKRALENVLSGEVWLCSGQSNMEWSMRHGILDGEAERQQAHHPRLRLFHAEKTIAAAPRSDNVGHWRSCDPESVYGFSAVAYFFGRELQQALDVPIGLIECAWGGTVVEAWTSAGALHDFGGFDGPLADLKMEQQRPGTLAELHKAAAEKWWRALEASDANAGRSQWAQPEFDDSAWDTHEVPRTWQETPLAGFDGLAWFRTRVEIPARWTSEDLILELGPVDDMDTTWFNGHSVGEVKELGHWATPRSYPVPAGIVRPGLNTIVVRVLDTRGGGGLYGKPADVRLRQAKRPDASLGLAGNWRYRVGPSIADLPAFPEHQRMRPNLPTVLFNGMIAPVVPYGIRGVIWYQGESNCARAEQYITLFPRMIRDWRDHWGRGDFPFYYVQIAPFDYRTPAPIAAELREAQRLALRTPNTGMAVTLDIGNVTDIHPRNKLDVGRRLALWAMAKTYGQDGLVHSGPLYRALEVEGQKVRILFDHADRGLVAATPLAGFEIAGQDGRFVPARAVIEGDAVVAMSDAVQKPIAVRYAWSNTAEATLFNTANLPASPFSASTQPR